MGMLSFLFSSLFSSFEINNFDWATVFFMLIGTSILSIIVPNAVSKNLRTHNVLKLVNECLARQQLAYIIFYLTLLVVSGSSSVLRRTMAILMVSSFIFYIIGLVSESNQDRKIEKLHGRTCSPGPVDCDLTFGFFQKPRVVLVNVLLSVISGVVALGLAFSPAVMPTD